MCIRDRSWRQVGHLSAILPPTWPFLAQRWAPRGSQKGLLLQVFWESRARSRNWTENGAKMVRKRSQNGPKIVKKTTPNEDRTGQDKTRQDKTRQDKTRQDKTRQDKTRQDKTRQGKARQDKIRHDHGWVRKGWHGSRLCPCLLYTSPSPRDRG